METKEYWWKCKGSNGSIISIQKQYWIGRFDWYNGSDLNFFQRKWFAEVCVEDLMDLILVELHSSFIVSFKSLNFHFIVLYSETEFMLNTPIDMKCWIEFCCLIFLDLLITSFPPAATSTKSLSSSSCASFSPPARRIAFVDFPQWDTFLYC